MAEPIGGKEHRWRWENLLVLGGLLELCATVLGWMVLIFLPLFVAQSVFERFGNTDWKYDSWRDLLKGKSFWIPFGESFTVKLVLVLCAFWFIAVVSSLLVMMYSRKKSKSLKVTPGEVSIDTAASPNALSKAPSSDTLVPVSGLVPATPEQERKNSELERRKVEQERREKIEKARKDFKAKVATFKDSLPRSYDLNVAGGIVDFSEKFKVTPLKVMMKEGSLRSYLTWNHEAMTLKVNDAFAFFKDGKARFCLEISDSAAAVDSELKDEIKPESL